MKKINLFITSILEKVLMLAMAAIVLVVTWQVFSRFIIQSPSSFTEELSRFLLIWIGILGAAYAYKTKAHLGLDLFVEKMAPARKHKALLLIECLTIFFASSVMIYGGLSLVSLAVELKQISASLNINMGIIYLAIPLSGVLIVMFALDNIIELSKNSANENAVEGES